MGKKGFNWECHSVQSRWMVPENSEISQFEFWDVVHISILLLSTVEILIHWIIWWINLNPARLLALTSFQPLCKKIKTISNSLKTVVPLSLLLFVCSFGEITFGPEEPLCCRYLEHYLYEIYEIYEKNIISLSFNSEIQNT